MWRKGSARIGTNEATVTPSGARWRRGVPPRRALTSSAATRKLTGSVAGQRGRDRLDGAEGVAQRCLLVAGLGEDGLGDCPPEERRVGLERRRGAARGAREGDELAGDDPQRAGRRLEIRRQIDRKHRLAVEHEGSLLAAARSRQERPQRQPPQPLIPAGAIAIEVAVGLIGAVGAAHDLQRLAERQPVLGIDVGESARHRRVHRHAQEIRPPERAERQLEEQRHHVEDPALGRARKIDDGVRQAAGLLEHRLRRAAGRRRRSAAGTTTAKSAKVRVSSPRTRDQISAAMVSSSRRGSVAGTTVRLSSEAARLRRATGARSSTAFWSAASLGARAPAAGSTKRASTAPPGQPGQELRVVAAGARPLIERRSLLAGRLAVPPSPGRGSERVDEEIGRARERLEDGAVEARHVGDPEQVNRGRRAQRRRPRVRAKKSGSVTTPRAARAARPVPAAPARSPRCQRCSTGSASGTSAPSRQAASISGREKAYSSNSAASSAAS